MMNVTKRILFLLCLSFPATNVWAFEPTLSCYGPLGSIFACQEGESPIPIFWSESCVAFHIQEDYISSAVTAELHDTIIRSFETWNVDCSHLQLSYGGMTDDRRVGYNQCGGEAANANIVSFVENDWVHAPRAVALTTVTYSPSTGRIYDADIELNSDFYELGLISGNCSHDGSCGFTDIENTLTHEVGHFLGLDHTMEDTFFAEGEETYTSATMYAETLAGETHKRELAFDDIQGVCTTYPSDIDNIPACRIDNDGDFQAPLREYNDPCPEEGCACTQRTSSPFSSYLNFFEIFLLGLIARQRRFFHSHR